MVAAVFTDEARPARAAIVVGQSVAGATISAWFRQAIVYYLLAGFTNESRYTRALIRVYKVNASSAIETNPRFTVVDVGVAVRSGETRWACALVARACALRASAVVSART